ncbi:maleylpyruvate isomerase N-terminal domain-containing protein [Streptosporangium sp. NPDC049644]|uniref:maleylpyruvate isomerase N-terminal domain-containing protein n=1 Tax=Streptosporangium sp. NPDC049644 TaxID=3155507 RepID=UPI00342EA47A
MAVSRPNHQSRAVRATLEQAGDRFARLLTSVPPQTMATRDWTVAETGAHVAAIAHLYTVIVRQDGTPHPMPELTAPIASTNVDTVADVNDLALASYPERDPAVLARRLRADIGELLRVTEHLDPATPIPWLGEARVPLTGLLAHLINEIHQHGWDIARSGRAPWTIPAREAALFFDLFLIGVIRGDHGRLLDTAGPKRSGRIAVRFHSRYTTPATLVLQDGRVRVEESSARTDVHLAFDPPTLNLMLFGRVSRPKAVLTGKIAAWGRRLWLLPPFLREVHLPDNRRPRRHYATPTGESAGA